MAARDASVHTVVDVPAMLGVLFDAMETETSLQVEAGDMRRSRRLTESYEHLTVPQVLMPPTTASLAPLARVHSPLWRIRDCETYGQVHYKQGNWSRGPEAGRRPGSPARATVLSAAMTMALRWRAT
ncbi:hypothetical protein [Streptomyces sp. NPDC049585]|uniref:hypothetical protein n=1 Tax=Streptomyces sp. NPDC049585 TaxID=3155154 RepID=UPI003432C879